MRCAQTGIERVYDVHSYVDEKRAKGFRRRRFVDLSDRDKQDILKLMAG